MNTKATETRTMKISEVKSGLSALVNEVYREGTRVLVEKSGIPVAALVSTEDLRRLNQMDRDREEGFRAMERISEAFAHVPVDELEAHVAAAIAEIREEDREERFDAIRRFSQAFADIPTEEAEAAVARIINENRERARAEAKRKSA